MQSGGDAAVVSGDRMAAAAMAWAVIMRRRRAEGHSDGGG